MEEEEELEDLRTRTLLTSTNYCLSQLLLNLPPTQNPFSLSLLKEGGGTCLLTMGLWLPGKKSCLSLFLREEGEERRGGSKTILKGEGRKEKDSET